MNKIKILVADSDPMSLNFLKDVLSMEGFSVYTVRNGLDVVELSLKLQPDVVILEANLPGMDGFQTCAKVRQLSDVPMIFVSTNHSVRDRIVGLVCGADDYVGKPFDSVELVLRLKCLLKRMGKLTGLDLAGSVQIADLIINRKNRTVKKRGRNIDLTAKEFDLLWLFINHPSRVYTRDQLACQIWNKDFCEDAAINMLIKRLRAKIEDDPNRLKWIKTVRGVGYKFECEYT